MVGVVVEVAVVVGVEVVVEVEVVVGVVVEVVVVVVMMLAETYLQLVGDAPHWCFEITVEIVSGIVVWPLGRRLVQRYVRRHDREVHGGDIKR